MNSFTIQKKTVRFLFSKRKISEVICCPDSLVKCPSGELRIHFTKMRIIEAENEFNGSASELWMSASYSISKVMIIVHYSDTKACFPARSEDMVFQPFSLWLSKKQKSWLFNDFPCSERNVKAWMFNYY